MNNPRKIRFIPDSLFLRAITKTSVLAIAFLVGSGVGLVSYASEPSRSPEVNSAMHEPSRLQQAMMKMMEAMESVEMTGDVDQDFARMMIHHHQGAIDMAQIELEEGHDPELRQMANEVVVAQQN